MINLLPPDNKRQLRAARANTLLARYNFFMIGAVVFLMLATGVTYLYLTNTKAAAEQTIQENNQKVADYSKVQTEATSFKNNLAVAKQILDREVTYTDVVLEISKLLPSGVILDNLNLDVQTFGTPTTLVAYAKNYEAALSLKNSFQESPLFSDVHFQSIANSSDQEGGATSEYPYTVNLSVIIQKDAAK